eukprot:SAG31_NODE_63_length_28659_cov_23.074685_18_plen_69_part_00
MKISTRRRLGKARFCAVDLPPLCRRRRLFILLVGNYENQYAAAPPSLRRPRRSPLSTGEHSDAGPAPR